MALTSPSTPEQLAYYSRHADERAIFGFAVALIQLAWAVTDFVGFRAIFLMGGQYMPIMATLATPLSVALLGILHGTLFVSLRTYYYDQLDDDPGTDSHWSLPALMGGLLILFSVWGSSLLMEQLGRKPSYLTTDMADKHRNEGLAAANAAYEATIQRTAEAKDRKLAALGKLYADSLRQADRIIANTKDRDTAKSLRQQRTALANRRDNAIGQINLAFAEGLERLNTEHAAKTDRIENMHTNATAAVLAMNRQEELAQRRAEAFKGWLCFVLPVCLALLFWSVTRRLVQINVRSGILPLHQFTDLQKRGGLWATYVAVLKDIVKRQGLRLSVWMHRKGTAGTQSLEDFSDDVKLRQAPPGPSPDAPPPRPRIRSLHTLYERTNLNGHKPEPAPPGKP